MQNKFFMNKQKSVCVGHCVGRSEALVLLPERKASALVCPVLGCWAQVQDRG